MADSDLFLLSIAIGAGVRNSLHSTRKEAEDALFAYVSNNWADEYPGVLPYAGRATTIAAYFDPEIGRGERESFIIEKLSAPAAKGAAAAKSKA